MARKKNNKTVTLDEPEPEPVVEPVVLPPTEPVIVPVLPMWRCLNCMKVHNKEKCPNCGRNRK